MSESKFLKKKCPGISRKKRLQTWNKTEIQNEEKWPKEKENLLQEQKKIRNVCIM